MGKSKSFADKMQKGAHDLSKKCPTCGESFTTIKLIRSEKAEKTEAWRFKEQFVGLCKCNAEQITK